MGQDREEAVASGVFGPVAPELVERIGDVVVLAGAGRLVHQGIDRIRAGSSDLVPGGGRVNLTLRVAGPTGSAGGFA